MKIEPEKRKQMLKMINSKIEKAMQLANFKKEFNTLSILESYREIINNDYVCSDYKQELKNSTHYKSWRGRKLFNLYNVPILFWYAIAHERHLKFNETNPVMQIVKIAKHGKEFWQKSAYFQTINWLINHENNAILQNITNNQIERYKEN